MLKELIYDIVKDTIRSELRVEVETISVYTGTMCEPTLYRDEKIVKLFLDDELISETFI